MVDPSKRFPVREDDACPLASWTMPRMVMESYAARTIRKCVRWANDYLHALMRLPRRGRVRSQSERAERGRSYFDRREYDSRSWAQVRCSHAND